MNATALTPIFLKDYKAPDFAIDSVFLDFDLHPSETRVRATLEMRRTGAKDASLRLNGVKMKLLSVSVDDRALSPSEYTVDEASLTLTEVPDRFTLHTDVEIDPSANTTLEGLYMSNGLFTTQCEAEGFRKITYFLDRPDVLSVYKVRLTADAASCPRLLSNGNPAAKGTLENGKHFAEWHDPHPKPSYLFALVAGDLALVEDSFTTRSGKAIPLQIFVDHGNEDKCDYAMDALKRSMAWDETAYGREYDLDLFMIVAVSDFNAGAMENKGLNIFNSALTLASPETATDANYERIETVIAHEYFHNWTGNRITCRDWFQLCLKEGLTVFRDQEFTSDMRSRSVKRIDDVDMLRTRQFPEDAGGLAHPVRPEQYIKIDNFYTATVYEKGAEIVRMISTLLGPDLFRKGMDLYFERHDGEAATVENFVKAFEDVSGRDLSQFSLWYSQAGTPEITAEWTYDPALKTLDLTLSQCLRPTPGQPHKAAMHVPVSIGLVSRETGDIPLQLEGENAPHTETSRVLELTQERQTFRFVNVPEEPIPSLLRGFSAPVTMKTPLQTDDYNRLIACDSDEFNRREAARRSASQGLTAMTKAIVAGEAVGADDAFVNALGDALRDPSLSPDFLSRLLTLPNELDIAQGLDEVDPDAVYEAVQTLTRRVATVLRTDLLDRYHALDSNAAFSADHEQASRRTLRNTILTLLGSLRDNDIIDLVVAQYRADRGMTDTMAALSIMVDLDIPERAESLDAFYKKWESDPLVVDKWFAVQASSKLPSTVANVKQLAAHPAFTIRNPNRFRALIGMFAMGNQLRFNDASGEGYRFFADKIIELDDINPLYAARTLAGLRIVKKLEPMRRALLEAELERIKAKPNLSLNVGEIVSKTLDG